jgi:hypothetical protein
MMHIGMTSDEIKNASPTDMIDWQRELCWQMAKLREYISQVHQVEEAVEHLKMITQKNITRRQTGDLG